MRFGSVLELRDNFTGVMRAAQRETSRFRRDVELTRRRMEQLSRQRHEIRIRASTTQATRAIRDISRRLEPLRRRIVTAVAIRDMITNRIRDIHGRLKLIANKIWTPVVKIKDSATAVLNRIKSGLQGLSRAAGSLALGGGVAGGALAAGLGMSVNSAMDLEKQQLSMKHFIGVQNQGMSQADVNKRASDYTNFLRQNANLTPFETNEVMSAGTRAINVAGGNTDVATMILKNAENMAALTPGKTLEQAMEALADLKVGETERMKEFGFKISQDQLVKASGTGKKQATDLTDAEMMTAYSNIMNNKINPFFAGGSEKLSQTSSGKLSTITGTFQNMMTNVGTTMKGILDGPMGRFGDWLGKNEPRITSIGQAIVVNIVNTTKSMIPIFKQIFVTLRPAINSWITAFRQVSTTVTPLVMGLLGVLKSVVRWGVAQMPMFMKAVVAVWDTIAPAISKVIGIAQGLWNLWMKMWPTIASILQTVWTSVIQPIFKLLVDVVSILWVVLQPVLSKAIDGFKALWTVLKPIVEGVGKVIKLVGGGVTWIREKVVGKDEPNPPGKAFGMQRVTRNNTLYRLHEGETVLTKQESNARKGMGNYHIAKLADQIIVREEADIDKVATRLYDKIKEHSDNMGEVA